MKRVILGFLVFTVIHFHSLDAENSGTLVNGNSENNPLQGKGAMLYLTRPESFSGSLSKLEVVLNGESIATLKNNSTFKYNVKVPGNSTVRVEATGLNKALCMPAEISILFENDKSYFVEIGWTNKVAEPLYIKQVAFEQVSGRFPELAGSSVNLAANNQVNAGNSNFENAQNEQIAVQKTDKIPTDRQVNISPVITEPAAISDVDKNIPVVSDKKPYLFALIIGNEDYSSFQNGLGSEVNVAYAANDARIFKEYAAKTLGVPEENTILLLNARAIEMNRAITKMNLFAKNSNGKAEFYIYYAGHGFPDEVSKEPYLMPVDVSGSDLQFAVKLNDLYRKMTEYPTQKVTIFLDACFSGGGRNQGLVAARGVKIKPREEALSGNLVVFTSSSEDQSSLAYKEEQHGMFTYFLLKKLQETKGKITYKALADYLTEQVGLNSIRVNEKEQNPQINISPDVQNVWELWKFSSK